MRVRPYIGQSTMTGLNPEAITGISVVDNINKACGVAGVVMGTVVLVKRATRG